MNKTKKKFKSFNETYPYCAFSLAIAMVYPNKHNLRKRSLLFALIIAINSGELFWFFIYLFKCLARLDMFNFARNMTIGILVTLFFIKAFYVNYKNDPFGKLLDKITEDLLNGNNMEEDYQKIYETYIKQCKIGQTCWIFIPWLMSFQFPVYAGICNIYESMLTDVGNKYMVHEMELKFMEDKQYTTPYFEIIYAYNCMQCIVLAPSFTGFDGSFCIATTHLRLKLKVMTHKLHKAFEDSKTKSELKKKVNEVIKDHQAALEFYTSLQDVYGGWLLAVFLLTSFLISFNLYQIYLIRRIDPKYLIFLISGVTHMFTPCYYASKVVEMGEEISDDIYTVSWENWASPEITKQLIFMIAKSQQHLVLDGLGIVVFDMRLCVSILNTSYSFFTLITSTK